MKNGIFLLSLLLITGCSTNKKLPVLKASSYLVSIQEGEELHQDAWTLSPQIEVDEFITRKFTGEKTVRFISDIDTLSFTVQPNKTYDFIIEINDTEKAYTRITTDTLAKASFPLKKMMNHYYKDKDRTASSDTIPFVVKEDHGIHITGSINDSGPLDFLFDTGANTIVVEASLVGNEVKANLEGSIHNQGSDGSLDVPVSTGNHLQIGDLHWDEVRFLAINYGDSRFDAVLGWVAFENKIVEIDYDRNEMIIHKTMPAIPEGYVKMETKMMRGVPYIKGVISVNTQKSSGWFEYDSGFNGSFSLSQQYASENQLNNTMKLVGTSVSSGSSGSTWKANNYILPELTFKELTVKNVPVSINEKDPKGVVHNDLLGNNLLKRFNAIIDLQNFEIYLKPNSLAKKPF